MKYFLFLLLIPVIGMGQKRDSTNIYYRDYQYSLDDSKKVLTSELARFSDWVNGAYRLNDTAFVKQWLKDFWNYYISVVGGYFKGTVLQRGSFDFRKATGTYGADAENCNHKWVALEDAVISTTGLAEFKKLICVLCHAEVTQKRVYLNMPDTFLLFKPQRPVPVMNLDTTTDTAIYWHKKGPLGSTNFTYGEQPLAGLYDTIIPRKIDPNIKYKRVYHGDTVNLVPIQKRKPKQYDKREALNKNPFSRTRKSFDYWCIYRDTMYWLKGSQVVDKRHVSVDPRMTDTFWCLKHDYDFGKLKF